MVWFLVGSLILLLGYLFYGTFLDKVFNPDGNRSVPSKDNYDGVDYISLGKKKNIFIQLLNIAGAGPIIGGVAGALFGIQAFVIIAVGNVFAGATHDFFIGMISTRNKGKHLPALSEKYLGKYSKHIVNVFALLVLFLVGVVFINVPVALIRDNFGNGSEAVWWIAVFVIFAYYLASTVLPIDKIIGKVYPVFGALLLVSSVAMVFVLLTGISDLGTIPSWDWDFKPLDTFNDPIYPMFFMTVACGLMSGFHATQSPIVARTMSNEKHGKNIFYGAMILEGYICMIWAGAAMALHQFVLDGNVVDGLDVSNWISVMGNASTLALGTVGGLIAIMGIIILPVTSGDTAFRSARNILATYINLDQKPLINRFYIAIPLFFAAFILVAAKVDINILWSYFVWANQVTAAIALFVSASYLFNKGALKGYAWLLTFVPGTFILSATMIFALNKPLYGSANYVSGAAGFFGLDDWGLSSIIGITITAIIVGLLAKLFVERKIEEA